MNETILMDAIFCMGDLGSQDRYLDEVEGVSLHDAIFSAINCFAGPDANKARAVINDRFGLRDGKFKSLAEVGWKRNTTAENVGLLELSGLRRLRHPSRSTKLKMYIKDSLE